MHGIIQPDGTAVHPKDWLLIKFKDGKEVVGRFSGVYQNPSFGLMYRLSYARPADGSGKSDTFFCPLREGNGCAEALASALIVEPPVKRNGKLIVRPIGKGDSVLH